MRKALGTFGIASLAIGCCAALPLLVGAGLSAAAFAWIGGIAVGVVVFAAVAALLVLRARRRAACRPQGEAAAAHPRDSLVQEVQIR